MTQRHEEAKRERCRAERERAQSERRLVPLMPILVRLNACHDAREWVHDANHATFRDAWNACPNYSWLAWLAGAMNLIWHLPQGYHNEWYLARTPETVRRIFPAHVVERALYDYAVREGLV